MACKGFLFVASPVVTSVARSAGVGAIACPSVRDPAPAWCLALLKSPGFARPRPHPQTQTWFLAVSCGGVS